MTGEIFSTRATSIFGATAPVETWLQVFVEQADRWGWLDSSLAQAARDADVVMHRVETDDPYRTYHFRGLSAAELKPFADYVLLRGGEGVWPRVADQDRITVLTGSVWIRPMGLGRPTIKDPHPYFVHFRELCMLLAWDERCQAWWASSGYLQFNFRQQDGDPDGPWVWHDDSWVYATAPLDLSLLSAKGTTQQEIEAQALVNVCLVLDRLAQRLDAVRPPLPAPLA